MPDQTNPTPSTDAEAPASTSTSTALVPLQDIITRCDKMVTEDSQRNSDFEAYERIYALNPLGSSEGKSSADGVMVMTDPHGKTVIDQVVKTYILNEPTITVLLLDAPEAKIAEAVLTHQNQDNEQADQLKAFLEALMQSSHRVSERNFIADEFFGASLYGELPIVIDNIAVEQPDTVDPAELEAPVIFSVPNPKDSHPTYSSRMGLVRHVFETKSTVGMVKEEYGSAADFLTGADEDPITLRDYMDRTQHTVFVKEQSDKAIIELAHGLSFIPRVSRRALSSPGFFTDPAMKQMPMLYAYLKAGLWAASNTALTTMYTSVTEYLQNKWLAKMEGNRQGPVYDRKRRGDTITIRPNESFGPLMPNAIPPEIFSYLALVTSKVEESTMPRIAQGAAPGGVAAASGLNILSVAARSAGYLICKAVQDSSAAACERTLRWVRESGQEIVVFGNQKTVRLKPSDIPKNIRVLFDIQPDMQAERQMVAGLASNLFDRMHLGYQDALQLLEKGGIIESSTKAFQNIIVRAMTEAELPELLKRTNQIVERSIFEVEGIPEAPAAPPADGTPRGMTPPDAGNLPPPAMPPAVPPPPPMPQGAM